MAAQLRSLVEKFTLGDGASHGQRVFASSARTKSGGFAVKPIAVPSFVSGD
jgi:hypothetical protein